MPGPRCSAEKWTPACARVTRKISGPATTTKNPGQQCAFAGMTKWVTLQEFIRTLLNHGALASHAWNISTVHKEY